VARLLAIEVYDLLVFFPLPSSSIVKLGLIIHPLNIFHYEGEFFITLDGGSGFEGDHLLLLWCHLFPCLPLLFMSLKVSYKTDELHLFFVV